MVNKVQIEDGGYYAIKGFVYQIDKTILEILENPESEISFEQNQDIDFEDEVIQVKYKEQAKYYPSSVQKPISQLLEIFQQDQTKKYHLYAYFSDQEERVKNLNLAELNKILGENSFDDSLKNNFLSAFTFNFSKNFDEHFESVIEKIKTEFSYSSDEEALSAHGIIIGHLFRQITNNNKENAQERRSSKSELNNILNNHKSCVFYSAYKEILGGTKYFTFVKSKFTKPRKENSENLVYFGKIKIDSSVSFGELIIQITEKHFAKATYNIQPITFVIPSLENSKIKAELIDKGIIFNDGFESIKFSSKFFLRKPLLTRKKVGIKAGESIERIEFKIRMIYQETFQKIIKKYSPDMIYYFDSEPLREFKDGSHIKVDGLNSQQILKLFN